MDQEIQKKLAEQEIKLDTIYRSVEKTRKYFLVIIWVTILGLVLPLIALAFVIPSFLSNYTNALNGF
jgi:type IV secretory pathway component VirB8